MATAQQVMNIAIKEIGYSRWTDDKTGTKYGRWYASKVGDSYYGANGVPYCAMFVSWCFDQAGDPKGCPGIPGAYCPWIVTAGRNSGQTVATRDARYGDVVLFDWGGDGVSDHIGFVESNNGSYLTCVEGNTTGTNGQSGGVNRRTRAYNTVICVIRPKYGESSGNSNSNNGSNNNSSSIPNNSGQVASGSLAAGTYVIKANELNVRTAPTTSAQVVAKYHAGSTVILDGYAATADGWIWGRYIGGSSGAYRYIAVKNMSGSVVYAAPVNGGGSSSSSGGASSNAVSTSVPSGTYKITANILNVRNTPSTSAGVVAQYKKGQTVTLDNWSDIAGGYIWGRLTDNTGAIRYIAVRTTNGTVYAEKI